MRKHLLIAVCTLALLLSSPIVSDASPATKPTTADSPQSSGFFVDHYKNNISANTTAESNPVIGLLSEFEIYEAFYDDYNKLKTFFHGHSYTGNQLGCAVALENLRLFESEKIVAQVAEKSKILESLFHDLAALPHVGDIRQLGFMSGIELVQSKETRQPYPPEERIGYRVSLKMRELGMLTRMRNV